MDSDAKNKAMAAEHHDREPYRATDGEYTIEVTVNGKWPQGRGSEAGLPAYRLRIVHEQYGVVHEEPQCASNQAFCVTKAVRIIQARRDEEARKKEEAK